MSENEQEVILLQDPLKRDLIYTEEDGRWSMILQLSVFAGMIIPLAGIIAPLVIWLTKRDQLSLVEKQGREVINLVITQVIAISISFLLTFILVGVIGFFVVGIHALIVIIVGAIKANERKFYKYPYIFRFIK